ncbi:(Fe-S)-binding protein [Endomicrobiia bacterium]|nr:(Fe-S)-binding protein [Endomicrobiia bacterium]
MRRKIVDIYFFTGTGNTLLAAKTIAETLKNNNCIVNVNDIAKTDPKKVNLSNTIGIGFPIACWNTFPIARSFINDLPNTIGTEVFTFATMGSSSLNVAANFGHILKNKGYSLIGSCGFLMPNNFIAVQKEEKNVAKREKAYKQMEHFASELVTSAPNPGKTNLFFQTCFAISSFIINRWKGNIFQRIAKFNITKSRCTKCGLCAKICPVKNILSENNCPVFSGRRCQLCMRCISYCPSHSIKFFLIRKTYRALTDEEMKRWFLCVKK